MKMTKIALAVATLLASTQAFAVPVTTTDITNARVAGTLQQVWVSGASASTKSIYEGWVGSGTGQHYFYITIKHFNSRNARLIR
jgi:hypothetical protein